MAEDFNTRGARLWASLMAQDSSLEDESNPVREVAITACRTADRVDHLEMLAQSEEPVVDGRGGPMIHPLYAEVRQQAQLLSRLIAALRLPDTATGKKPQARPPRGTQKPSAVSSLDRARQAKTGA